MTKQVKLFRKNSYGIGTWRIWQDGDILRYAHATSEGASEVAHEDRIQLNGSGRNLEQQMQLEMNSRISRMLDKGYKYLREEALAGATNQMGFINPMLAQSLDPQVYIDLSVGAHVQPKLDGHRCLITNFEGELIAYTRKGKPITTVNHVLRELTWLPEGRTLDGELYIHGLKLQAISSLIKREQSGSANLRYHWYDYVSSEPFATRHQCMANVVNNIRMRMVDLVETVPVFEMGQVYELFRKYRAGGYEGAMLRHSMAGYQDGKRAFQLLKVKERHDCEVIVIGVKPSKEGWAVLRVQYQLGMGIQHEAPRPGATFDVAAPGTHAEKTEVLENFDTKYKGRKLKIEYASLTDEGIPFHAVAMEWFEEL